MSALRQAVIRAGKEVVSPAALRLLFEPVFALLGRRRGKSLKPEDVRRVLVMRLDDVGDIVLSSGFFRELRKAMPGAEIVVVVKHGVESLLETCPYIDSVQTLRLPEGNDIIGRAVSLVGAIRTALKSLYPSKFDLALCPRWDSDILLSKMTAYMSGARWIIGYSADVVNHKRTTDRGYDSWLTHSVLDCQVMHESERGGAILAALGVSASNSSPELWLTADDQREALVLLQQRGLHPGAFAAFGIGAQAAKRKWPLERFAGLARWLYETYGLHCVALGSPAEAEAGLRFEALAGNAGISLVGLTDLRVLAAIISRSSMFVGNDSGPMHMASAAGIPVVEISCHTDNGWDWHQNAPERFGPLSTRNMVNRPQFPIPPCVGCCSSSDAHCITSVTEAEVRDSIISLALTL